MFGLIGSIKTFSKVLGVDMNVGPYMAYILYIKVFFILYTKKSGFWGKTNFITSFWQFLVILVIKMADFLKLELFKTIFEN